jgi:hypothetical protein
VASLFESHLRLSFVPHCRAIDETGGHPPALTMPFSLQLYLDQFDAVCQSKFGRSYDLAKPENFWRYCETQTPAHGERRDAGV